MSAGSRLKQIRQKYGLSQAKFAKKTGMVLRRVQNLEGDRVQKFNKKETNILLEMGINKVWLLTGEGEMHAGSCKMPLWLRPEAIDSYEPYDFMQHAVTEMKTNTDFLRVVEVKGDSMEPLLRNGDHLFIDTNQCTLNKEGVYIMHMGNMLLARNVQLSPEGVRLTCSNKSYSDIDVSTSQQSSLAVIGRVVGMMRFLR
jgi:transcriptional regulator with XRE-family HTH domain